MPPWSTIAAGILGAILGSFLNALLFRYNTGRSVLRGRSSCMRCGHMLSALDLVPLFSYLFLRGRCRYCRSRISMQYPAVEALGALAAVLICLNYPDPGLFFFWLVVWMVLLFVLVYDLRHTIIPWTASGFLAVLGLIWVFSPCIEAVSCQLSAVSLLAGPLLATPLFLVSLVSAGRWMGWGDSGLELGLGWLLGLSAGLTAFMIAFWSGALVGITLLLFGKRYTMKSEVPFAPFLIFGAAAVYFLHVDLFSQISVLWN